MTPNTPAKRRRGGQPGNQNAKGNRGNKLARGRVGNRGGRGAPFGNRFACVSRTLDTELLKELRHCPEAVAWIRSNAEALQGVEVSHDSRLSFGVYHGLTPEALAECGQEYRYGLYHNPEAGHAGTD